MEMDIINSSAAGIDIGSKSHYVAVGQALEDVKEFGVYAEDLTDICLWLKSYDITSVAMESTGDYWQNLYTELIKHGFEVILVNGKFTKNAKGKKTDVKDCRWIKNYMPLDYLPAVFSLIKPPKHSGPIADKEPIGLMPHPPHPEKCRSI